MNKYSIIVPVYNAEKYIQKCINSILSQTYTNIELILINDGSIDNSTGICQTYKQKDDRIVYIEQENHGVSYARNKGIEVATGNYVTFVDADDYLEKNTLEILNNTIEKYNCDIVKYGYIKETKLIKKSYKFSIKSNTIILNKDYKTEIYPYIFKTFDLSNIWNAIYKRELIKKLKFDENLKYGEDFKFMVQAILNSQSFFIETKELYHYVYNSNSVINTSNVQKALKRLVDNVNGCLDIKEQIERVEDVQDADTQVISRIRNAIMVFCAFNANNCTYQNYIQKTQEFIQSSKLKEAEKRYFEVFNKNMWQEVLNEDYYNKLTKFNKKMKLKKVILKLLGG